MRRRLAIAIVGLVVAALLLTGIGTIVLASVANREDAELDLREQVEAIGDLLTELTLAPAPADSDETIRQRLQRVASSISVEGVGLLVLPRNSDPIGELPAGLTLEELDLAALRAGETVSSRTGDLIWAARGSTSRQGIPQLLVLTADADPILLPGFSWFLVASATAISLAILVTVRLSRRLTEPIREARDVTGRLTEGDLAARIPPEVGDVGDEVGDLLTSINQMADSLQRSHALERQFLLSVSHDLRTPLTSIKGYAEALTDGAVDDVSRVGEIIESEAKRLERLVGDLLLLARLESTDFPLHLTMIDPRLRVTSVTDGLQPEAVERGIVLTARVPDHDVSIEVDPDRFAQIVANLVSNALRYASQTVSLTLWEAEGRIHIAVGDDGPGIPDADLPYVFDRLYTASANPAVKESGGGLGLAIVRDLTDRMGGSVMARRSALGGAEFVVSFGPAH